MKKAKLNFLFLICIIPVLSISVLVSHSINNNLIKKTDLNNSLIFFEYKNNEIDTKLILKEFAEKINISPIRKYESVGDVDLTNINENNLYDYFKNLPWSTNEINTTLKRIYLTSNEFEEIHLEYEFSYNNKDQIVAIYSFKKIAFVSSKKIIINFVAIPISLIFLTLILGVVIYLAIKKAEKEKKYNYLKSKMKK